MIEARAYRDDIVFHTRDVRRLYTPCLQLLRGHLLRLDPQTRRERFGLEVTDPYLGHYAALCFAPGVVTYGYFEEGLIRGTAELHIYTSNDLSQEKSAEAAFSVERQWRRRGIGTELMSHVVLAARNRRITILTIVCQRRNQAMLNLTQKFSGSLKYELNDVSGHITGQSPTPLSLWRELVNNTLDLGAAALSA